MIPELHHETPLEIVATLTTCGPFGRAGSENSRPFTTPLPWRGGASILTWVARVVRWLRVRGRFSW